MRAQCAALQHMQHVLGFRETFSVRLVWGPLSASKRLLTAPALMVMGSANLLLFLPCILGSEALKIATATV